MSGAKVPIPKGNLEIEENAVFAGFQKDLDQTKETMRLVVLVLLIMVGAMIFSLQIAISQTKQPGTINVNITKEAVEAVVE